MTDGNFFQFRFDPLSSTSGSLVASAVTLAVAAGTHRAEGDAEGAAGVSRRRERTGAGRIRVNGIS